MEKFPNTRLALSLQHNIAVKVATAGLETLEKYWLDSIHVLAVAEHVHTFLDDNGEGCK